MIDQFGRNIDYLRISLTDRCNLRCSYCMPNGVCPVSHAEILSYEEILCICKEAIALGITHFKVTGGEPLVRKGILAFLQQLKSLSGCETVTLTSNGTLLNPFLKELREIGIDGINISLDAANAVVFARITGSSLYEQVFSALCNSVACGIKTKINCVLLAENQDQILPLASFAQQFPVDVRFIELMPIGEGATLSAPSPKSAREQLLSVWPDLHPVDERRGFGPARYEQSAALLGRIGWIDALSHSFCASCNRIRLTSTGLLKPCLCYGEGRDLRRLLRSDNQESLREAMAEAIFAKPAAHCFQEQNAITEHRKMAEIGG
ncbi:MAG: GTP 3',8-cyclase MoaA [bacterium]|nr:GTP 3',8-cyclase MoaA [bacterium]